ncbi:MAG: LysR family transcriptional regulator [Pseudomonadales bacterium]
MQNWNEFKTAYKLAELKTLSATAKVLDVHRSTVMRHIDSLEAQLGVKLFQRSDRGYLPTEAGIELMRLGENTEQQLKQLSARLQDTAQQLTGRLSITCVNELAELIMPALLDFNQQHPSVQLDIIGDLRNFNLEYGEADIAIRAGTKPSTPDNVVLPLCELPITLCAHRDYCAKHGIPSAQTLVEHRFLALRERLDHLPWNAWIYDNVPPEQIALTASDYRIVHGALEAGMGLAFTTRYRAQQHPALQLIPLQQQWSVPVWLLVHRDMLKAPKVSAFLNIMRTHPLWESMNTESKPI